MLAQSPSFVTLVPGDDFNQWALFGGPTEEVDLGGQFGMVSGVSAVIGALAANVPAGVITTLPDPSITATFNTVPWNPIPLDEATAAQLNGVFNNTDPSLGAPGYNVILQLTQVPCLNGIQAAGGNFCSCCL